MQLLNVPQSGEESKTCQWNTTCLEGCLLKETSPAALPFVSAPRNKVTSSGNSAIWWCVHRLPVSSLSNAHEGNSSKHPVLSPSPYLQGSPDHPAPRPPAAGEKPDSARRAPCLPLETKQGSSKQQSRGVLGQPFLYASG